MTGQFQSKLTCLKCGRVSNKFDPFTIVPLPIPEPKQDEQLICYVIPFNWKKDITLISLKYGSGN